ncbi:MAG: hypothetical protein LBI36_06775 [Oscillospiraceae bacterium]|nr:hypothetical protein [Oscillospiraceae bacterium]
MKNCFKCGKELFGDETAIYRKLVNALAAECLCIPCTAARFNCGVEDIRARIRYYRESGTCGLFK